MDDFTNPSGLNNLNGMMSGITTQMIIAGFLFGSIGFVAFVYGKKRSLWKPAIIGIALMAYPYFVYNTAALYAIGIFLTAALFVGRD